MPASPVMSRRRRRTPARTRRTPRCGRRPPSAAGRARRRRAPRPPPRRPWSAPRRRRLDSAPGRPATSAGPAATSPGWPRRRHARRRSNAVVANHRPQRRQRVRGHVHRLTPSAARRRGDRWAGSVWSSVAQDVTTTRGRHADVTRASSSSRSTRLAVLVDLTAGLGLVPTQLAGQQVGDRRRGRHRGGAVEQVGPRASGQHVDQRRRHLVAYGVDRLRPQQGLTGHQRFGQRWVGPDQCFDLGGEGAVAVPRWYWRVPASASR